MTEAHEDREHGNTAKRTAAVAAANRAGAIVHEVIDESGASARHRLESEVRHHPERLEEQLWLPGRCLAGLQRLAMHPEGAWQELQRSADAALERLEAILRELLGRQV